MTLTQPRAFSEPERRAPISTVFSLSGATDAYGIRSLSICGGTLGFGRCPGLRRGRFRHDRLVADLDWIAAWKPSAILCLAGEEEVEGLDLSLLGHEARLRGIGCFRPGPANGAAPKDGQGDWRAIAPRLWAALTGGDRLLLHGARDIQPAVAAAERLLAENGVTAAAARLLLDAVLDEQHLGG